MNPVRTAGIIGLVLLACLAAGCGGTQATQPTSSSRETPATTSPTPSGPPASPPQAPVTLSVSPPAPALFPGEQVRFSAQASDHSSVTDVDWYVNGVQGGYREAGTIAPNGAYTAPPSPLSATLKAVSRTNRALAATASVNVSMTAVESDRPVIFRFSREDLEIGVTGHFVIFGANFREGAKVVVGAQEVSARVVDGGTIDTELPPLSAAGEVPVFVINPGTPERIAARNLHVAKPFEQGIGSFGPGVMVRALPDPARGLLFLITIWQDASQAVVIDLNTRTVRLRYPIPGYFADFDPATGRLYVLPGYPSWACTVSIFDAAQGTPAGVVDLGPGACQDVRIHSRLGRGYVINRSNAMLNVFDPGILSVFDLATNEPKAPIGPLVSPNSIVLDAASSTALVKEQYPISQAAVVDLATGEILRRLDVGSASSLVLDGVRGRMYTVGEWDGTVRVRDINTNQISASLPIAAKWSIGDALLNSAGTSLLLPAMRDEVGDGGRRVMGDLWIIDPSSLRVQARVPIDSMPQLATVVGDSIVTGRYTLTILDMGADFKHPQLGGVTAQKNGDQIEMLISGMNFDGVEPALYFDGAPLSAEVIDTHSLRATVPISWAESSTVHSLWLGKIGSTASNVLGFGFSPASLGGGVQRPTFCLGPNGLALLAGYDDGLVKWMDLRKGIELRSEAGSKGNTACAIHQAGKFAALVNANENFTQIYDPTTGSSISRLTGTGGPWYEDVVIDSTTDLAYLAGDQGSIVNLQTATVVGNIPGLYGDIGIDPSLKKLISYSQFVDLRDNSTTATGINLLIDPNNPLVRSYGGFGVDPASHLSIMPWRYGETIITDIASGQSRLLHTGGDLARGACAGDGLGFVLDTVTPAVIAVDLLAGRTVTKFSSPPVPGECAYDAETKMLYVLSASTGELFEIRAATSPR